MNFVSIRIITGDIKRLVGFYERATGVPATWYTEDFAEITTPRATLAIGSTRTVPLFGPGVARPADNHTVIIEGSRRAASPHGTSGPPLIPKISWDAKYFRCPG